MLKKLISISLMILIAVAGFKIASVSIAQTAGELEVIQAGIDVSYSSVSTGRGMIQIHSLLPKITSAGALEIDSLCSSVFARGKFKLAVEDTYIRNDPTPDMSPNTLRWLIEPGSKISYINTYDGQILTKYEDKYKSATRGDLGSRFAVNEFIRFRDCFAIGPFFFASMGLGFPTSYLASPDSSVISRMPTQIIGREIIENDECVIVEFQDTKVGQNGENFTRIVHQWIDLEKGFCAPRIRIWNERADRGRYLILTSDSELRQYEDGAWRASRTTIVGYRLDPNTHTSVEGYRHIITYNPDFQFNVPVSEEELQLILPPGTLVRNAVTKEEYIEP